MPSIRAADCAAVCLHCRCRPGYWARGLCASCHRRPGVRDLYARVRRPVPLGPPSPRPPRPWKPFAGTCRHCRRHHVNRPRGLCWACYYAPGVRSLYPSAVNQGVAAAMNGGYQLPDRPTDAAPGSPEKIAVLTARAKARVQLHHPDDLRPRGGAYRRLEPCRVFRGPHPWRDAA